MSPEEEALDGLLALVARMSVHAPHVPCPVDDGPLAPLVAALNHLSEQRAKSASLGRIFGPPALLAQARSLMASCDTEARIRYHNHFHPGMPAERVIGTSLYDWFPPESVDPLRRLCDQVLSTGESVTLEFQLASLTGLTWYQGVINPIQVDGRTLGFTLVGHDVTELKKSQQSLERSNQELEGFASSVSHDLQEPLRDIQALGERIKTTASTTLSPEGRGYIERMQKAASRMRGLIDALRSFSRVSAGPPSFVPVDLGTVAREVLGDLETAIERSGARVSLGELPVLDADPIQMRQLLQNLVGNALKFRREGTPLEVSVRGTVDPLTRRCTLVVQDNGIGFEERYVERIFELFQRLHGREKYEGSGIGLAICRKIIERHGGHIAARGIPGQGATFTLSLPLEHPSHP